jgi:hypothetical protein
MSDNILSGIVWKPLLFLLRVYYRFSALSRLVPGVYTEVREFAFLNCGILRRMNYNLHILLLWILSPYTLDTCAPYRNGLFGESTGMPKRMGNLGCF